jgi:subtilase family serine protease
MYSNSKIPKRNSNQELEIKKKIKILKKSKRRKKKFYLDKNTLCLKQALVISVMRDRARRRMLHLRKKEYGE